ncbi:MAG: phosphoribosylformylglycinamidine synthase subunit PurL [Candidatus Omnitrophica bacterium]|nr:phosphoribosylformylglycinamidine synthase subunit PurL [Candidatus Omnitrophota bacterium]
MICRIDVFPKFKVSSPRISSLIKDLGFKKQIEVYTRKVFLIDSDISLKDLDRLAKELLIDPILEDYTISQGILQPSAGSQEILITFNPGVCDSVALSFEKALKDLNLNPKTTRTARFYEFRGLTPAEIKSCAAKVLFNPLIEHIVEYDKVKDIQNLDEFSGSSYNFDLITIDILSADDERLQAISRQGCLSLSLDEMRIIKAYFQNQKRNPTDCELETIATLWSEHCAHKTFRGIIDYREEDKEGKVIKKETIDSLLKTTLMKATNEIAHKDCVSVFHDNSGVVKFDDNNNICFKVETHNHPSSLEPYGGAATGIGGVIRDILGTGCSARPFASIDVFCFSPWHISYKELPEGLLHPKRIIKGVVKGVRDYGNRMGIPTVAGSVIFDQRYLGNPLVYCGTLGIIPSEKSNKRTKPGDLVFLAGAKTGRDGIHGATFSSKELDEQTVGLTSAVQIGNPIEEKKLTEAILRARDKDLFTAITDCGAGGISSAITELAQGHGVEVDLEKVPLKYTGLSYTEIWISESQERMVFFSSQENLDELKKIFQEEDVDLTVVGKVRDSKSLILRYQGNKVCELELDFIFNLPKLRKEAVWVIKDEVDYKLKEKHDYSFDLKSLLGAPNIASKDWILREYDHEVQAGSVVKSLAGIENLAANDASVVRPDLKSPKCVAIGLGINPFYSDIDAYHMSALAIDEALRNVVSAGGRLEKTFILDNFSWGSPAQARTLGSLVRAAKACYDFATYYKTPFISGKDSLYNEYIVADKHISIPGTLLISAVSVIDDWQKVMTADFKQQGNLIYIVGFTKPELGASEYFRLNNLKQGIVPKVDRDKAKKIFSALSKAIGSDLIESCHDLSEGGLSVAVAEMCISSDLGASIFLGEVPAETSILGYEILFSESATRFVIEVKKENKDKLEHVLRGLDYGLIGCISQDKKLTVFNKEQKEIISLKVDDLRNSWLDTFEEFRK